MPDPGWPRLALADLTYQLPPCTLSSAGQPRPTPRLSSPPSAGLNDSPPDPGNGLWLPPSTTFYFATPAAAPTAPLAPPALTTIRSAINRRQPSNNTCIRSHTYPRRHRQERIHQHAVPRCTPARRDTQQRADQPIGNQKPAALNPPQQVHRTLRRRLLLVALLNVLGHLRLGFLLLVKPGRQDRRGAVAVHLQSIQLELGTQRLGKACAVSTTRTPNRKLHRRILRIAHQAHHAHHRTHQHNTPSDVVRPHRLGTRLRQSCNVHAPSTAP